LASIATHRAIARIEAGDEPGAVVERAGPAARGRLERVAPVYAVATAIALGDGLGNFRIFAPLWIAIAISAGAAVAFAAARRRLGYLLALAALAAVSTVPVAHLLASRAGAGSLRAFADGSTVTIEGTVVREPEHLDDRTRLYVAVARAGDSAARLRAASGRVRITSADDAAFRAGDELRLTGRIRFPRNNGDWGEFDYEGFMARQGIAATMTARAASFGTPAFERIGYHPSFPASEVETIRGRIGAFIDATLPPPERAEMRALVIGDRGGITDELRNTFARTGMAHLLVISGLHLSFVAAAVFALLRLLMMAFPGLASRGYANKTAALGAALAVCAYAAIAGHHISTARALVMVLSYMFAVIIDRAREALASLALAAIVICIALPGSTADVGFQLSFASVIAIILGMRRFAAWSERRWRRAHLAGERRSGARRAGEVMVGYVAVSFWALAGTAPLTAYHFNQFSMVGLAANAVVVPIMGFGATLCGLGAAALSFIWTAPARALLELAGLLLAASNRLAAWFVEWPAAWSRIFTPTIPELLIAYAGLLLWLTAPLAGVARPGDQNEKEGPDVRAAPRTGWTLRAACAFGLALALATDAAWWIHDRYFSPDLRVSFLSVGEGDAAVVRFPGARVMLIDAGAAYRSYDYGERVVARYLWSRKIMRVDYLVLSHPDADHFGGFAFIARNFDPAEFWAVRAPSADVSYAALLGVLASDRVRLRLIDSDTPPAKMGGARIEALGPEPDRAPTRNNSSMVLRIDYGAMSFLFTGDIETPAEHVLLARGGELHATVLKVPHHGSASSSSAGFVEAVRPALAVISDGYVNRFHFPARGVVARYRDSGAIVLRTDLAGAVFVDTDRWGARIESYRGPGIQIRAGGGRSGGETARSTTARY
jgi:competence protein ComEC